MDVKALDDDDPESKKRKTIPFMSEVATIVLHFSMIIEITLFPHSYTSLYK